MSWHNTHFAVLYNYTNSRWNVVALEDPGWGTIIVEPSTSRQMYFKVFPWCTGRDEIVVKAFRFNRGGDATSGGGATAFYLYQDYESRKVQLAAANGEPQPGVRDAAESVNVYLTADNLKNWNGVEIVKST